MAELVPVRESKPAAVGRGAGAAMGSQQQQQTPRPAPAGGKTTGGWYA